MRTAHVALMHARVHTKRVLKFASAVVSTIAPANASPSDDVVVLMYHRVNAYRNNDMSVTPDKFAAQLRWLKNQGYENVRIRDLENGLPHESDRRRVILTFDDAYQDNYVEAFPILQRFGYTAIFYVPVDFVGSDRMDLRDLKESNRAERNRRMTWEQLRDMVAGGMEIGSHTLSHSKLTTIAAEAAAEEIVNSKRRLEDELGVTITSFCYPGGFYDGAHVRMVEAAGYRSACTASPGRIRGLFEIPRVAVQASDSMFVFKKKIGGGLRWSHWVR
jgi:peptidoglycan/xylan/chitin deacetylase (PgdA/CDA1 family)